MGQPTLRRFDTAVLDAVVSNHRIDFFFQGTTLHQSGVIPGENSQVNALFPGHCHPAASRGSACGVNSHSSLPLMIRPE